MIPLPPALGGGLVGWRLDEARHSATWGSGIGASLAGGRWNNRGVPAVYCSLDPAAAILEVAANKGFNALDTLPYVLTAFTVSNPASIHVVQPGSLPNPNWLAPGRHSRGQRDHGDALLRAHPFVLVPSAVSNLSWNLLFLAPAAPSAFSVLLQDRLALDPRLHPPP